MSSFRIWLRSVFRFGSDTTKRRPVRRASALKLQLEQLENRTAPATLQLVSHVDPSMISDSAAGASSRASVSQDGHFVAFISDGVNLVAGQVDSRGTRDVFVHDRVLDTNRLVSGVTGSTTTTGNGESFSPVISADGRFVAFLSNSTNLVSGQVDVNGNPDVFVFDRLAGTTRLVSGVNGSTTTTGNGRFGAFAPVISSDGQFIAFGSLSTNLVPGQVDANDNSDVFVFDRVAGTTRLVSGVTGSITNTGNGGSSGPSAISANGQFIAFESTCIDLVGHDDQNGAQDVFVFDRLAGTTRLVSGVAGSATTTGNDRSDSAVISSDGQFIAFQSLSTNLVTGQHQGNFFGMEVFVFDRLAGTTRLVSGVDGSTTTTGVGESNIAAISADGKFIAFLSNNKNLVSGQVDGNGDNDNDNDNNFGDNDGDNDNSSDVFVFDRVAGTTRLVSGVDGSTTTTGNSASFNAVISDDGHFIAFRSASTNLVTGQVDSNHDGFGNPGNDVFVFDRLAGTTRLVSAAAGSTTTTGTGSCDDISVISGDGNFIAFQSFSTNLVIGRVDGNANADVFLFDRAAGNTGLVSRRDPSLPNLAAGGISYVAPVPGPSLSQDGRFLVYVSGATNLVAGQVDSNNSSDVFVYDRVLDTNRLVSGVAGSSTTAGNGASSDATISADGRFITFRSLSTNLVAGQVDSADGDSDVFVFDWLTGTTRLVSGVAGSTTTTGDGSSTSPVISGDGRFIAFTSSSTNLVSGQVDTPGSSDVFVFDRVAGTTRLVSGVAGSATATGNGFSSSPVISGDGQFIAFQSLSSNLVAGQVDSGSYDVFVFDRVAGMTRLVSGVAGSTTTTGNNGSYNPVISGDGQFIAFQSLSSNLVSGQVDANSLDDIFVFDRLAGTTRLVSGVAGSTTTTGNGNSPSLGAVINSTGQFIAFTSSSTNLVAGQTDPNGFAYDVFVFDRVAGTTRFVSGAAGSTTNSLSDSPAISSDGRVIAFRSYSTNLVTGQVDANGGADVFVFDQAAGTTRLISAMTGSTTTTGNSSSGGPVLSRDNQLVAAGGPVISGDGQFIAFSSRSTNLTTDPMYDIGVDQLFVTAPPINTSAEVFADFGAAGLAHWSSAAGWQTLTTANAETMVVASSGELYGDFGDSGLWRWSASAGWLQLTGANPEQLRVGGNGTLYGDFGASGLWRWSSAAGWLQLTTVNPERMAPSPAAGNDELFASFGNSWGLWRWTSAGWQQLTPANPEDLTVGRDGRAFGDFGSLGLWTWTSAAGWLQLTNANSETLAPGAPGDLFADFGSLGLWHWNSTSGWQELDAGNAQALAAAPSGDLFADMGSAGLWHWTRAAGFVQLSPADAEGFCIASSGDLFGDFGTTGFWIWTASSGWTRLETADAENLATAGNG